MMVLLDDSLSDDTLFEVNLEPAPNVDVHSHGRHGNQRLGILTWHFPSASGGRGGLFGQRHGDETLGPLVLVEGVMVDTKAVRLVAEPGQFSGPEDALLGLLFGGVGAKDLQIVPVLLVPDQFPVLATMSSRSAVKERRMPNVSE